MSVAGLPAESAHDFGMALLISCMWWGVVVLFFAV
jgi:hypothetical protein